jgi:sigma-B regulation protein RsbU (phosphoserine phosphatase)
VGGDYYDFIPTRPQLQGRCREQGRWALVMGDVMGKGVPASLLMTLLRGMLRAEVLTGLPPDRILHDLNQLAQEDLAHSHRFVTLFYSDFDPPAACFAMPTRPTIRPGLATSAPAGGPARCPWTSDRS